jgi:hypothetical protein
MTYEILKPFGPLIYKTKLDQEFMTFIKLVSDQTKEKAENVGETLAGNLQKQFAVEMTDDQKRIFFNAMRSHIFDCVFEIEKKYNTTGKKDFIDKEKFRYDFGPGPWINFQEAGEFNPIHSHTGKLSAILYIDVPECIAEENNSSLKTNAPSAGNVVWVYGSTDYGTDYNYQHQPVTGELFLFPAGLTHMVYPFKSNVERISMSFNVYNIGW